jgi:beta-mannosidase
MVYHDMMNRDYFSGMQQEVNAYRNTIRRLSTHPSIVIWDGCNECNPNQGQIGTTVMTIVTSEDSSRAIWPSCPAAGWASGVNRLSSLPNGKTLKPSSSSMQGRVLAEVGALGSIETHGPYQHGDGWPAVNGAESLNLFDPMLPLPMNPTAAIGLGHPNTFTSEFGSVGWSSWESVSPTIAPQHWSLHGGAPKANCSGGFQSKCTPNNVMAQRKSEACTTPSHAASPLTPPCSQRLTPPPHRVRVSRQLPV